MAENERDTHFQGFAHLLVDEIKAKYAWIEPFQGEGSELDDLYTVIAQRAYDLVHSGLTTLFNDIEDKCDGLIEFGESVHDQGGEYVEDFPDMSAWPEHEQGE